MTYTPKLLRYARLSLRQPPLDPPVWVAIVKGSPSEGGEGVILSGSIEPNGERRGSRPGDDFMFGGNNSLNAGCEREVWGLDSDQVPPEVVVAWMKFKHQGKLG